MTSLVLRKAGKSCASLDLQYHTPKEGKQNYMDLLSPSGFALLELAFFLCFWGLGVRNEKAGSIPKQGKLNFVTRFLVC